MNCPDVAVTQDEMVGLQIGAYPSGGSSSMPYLGEHVYGTAVDFSSGKPQTYFDCGGGHTNSAYPPDNLFSTKGSLLDMVRMTLGVENPPPDCEPEYGHNDVSGKETCGVRMSGWTNRDGTCQQAMNRLLYAISFDQGKDVLTLGSPSVPLRLPRGYWYSVKCFGIWGVNFSSWCVKAGFPVPLSEEEVLASCLGYLDPRALTKVIDYLISSDSEEMSYQKMIGALDSDDLVKMGITKESDSQITGIQTITNNFFGTIHFSNTENAGNAVDIPPGGSAQPGNAWIPWCDDAGTFNGHHMSIVSSDGSVNYTIWQSGSAIYYWNEYYSNSPFVLYPVVNVSVSLVIGVVGDLVVFQE